MRRRAHGFCRLAGKAGGGELVGAVAVSVLLRLRYRIFAGQGGKPFDLRPEAIVGQVNHRFCHRLQVFKGLAVGGQTDDEVIAQAPTGRNRRDVGCTGRVAGGEQDDRGNRNRRIWGEWSGAWLLPVCGENACNGGRCRCRQCSTRQCLRLFRFVLGLCRAGVHGTSPRYKMPARSHRPLSP